MVLSTMLTLVGVGVAATLAAALVVGIGLARVDVDDPISRRATVTQAAVATTLLVLLAAVATLDVWDAFLAATLPAGTLTTVWTRLVGAVILAGFLGTPAVVLGRGFSLLLRVRSGDVTRGQVLTTGGIEVLAIWTFLALTFATYALVVATAHPLVAVLALIALAFALQVAKPAVTFRSVRTRPPTADERDVIDSATDVTGFPIDRVVVIDDPRATDVWRPISVGLPPTRKLLLPASCFERYDSDELETVLVLLTRRPTRAIARVLVIGAYFGGALAIVLSFDGFPVGEAPATTIVPLLSILALVAVGPFLVKRLVFRADRRLAETVGAGRIVRALDRMHEERGGVEAGVLQRHVHMVPSIEARIQRLGGRPDGATAPPSTDGTRPADGATDDTA